MHTTDMGSRLREERMRIGLSGQLVAERIGISHLTYKKYERGERQAIKAKYLDKLTELGFDVAYIQTGKRAVNVPESGSLLAGRELSASTERATMADYLIMKGRWIEAHDLFLEFQDRVKTVLEVCEEQQKARDPQDSSRNLNTSRGRGSGSSGGTS